MFLVNEDKSIYLTRGDVANFGVSAKTNDGEQYTFRKGDVVRFKVFSRKGCSEVALSKDMIVEEETTEVTIFLTKDDTKIGDFINKPKNYWYEVELNPDTTPRTIIGYDDEGEKVLRLFPEGGDWNG